MYAVIEIDQDYDCVEGLECVAAFATEAEGVSYVDNINKQRTLAWNAKISYVDEFVDKINVPENHGEFIIFLEKFNMEYGYIYPGNFKMECKSYLLRHDLLILEGYNPPALPEHGGKMFVVKITS